MRRGLTLGVLGLALGCAALPELERDTCGNAVIENGEDCDTFADDALGGGLTCGSTCQYLCPTGNTCPPGWQCGGDGFCRFASGTFTPAPQSPFVFPAQVFLLGDLDADGAPDLLGGAAGRIEARYGEPQGTFRERHALSAVLSSGLPTLARFDNDDTEDLLSPTPEGLDVFLGDEARVLTPAGHAPILQSDLASAGAEDAQLVPLPAPGLTTEDALLALSVRDEQLWARVAPADEIRLGPAPGDLAGRVVRARLTVAREAVAVGAVGGAEIYVVAARCPAPGCPTGARPEVVATLELGPLGTVAAGARLFDVDGDGLADVVTGIARDRTGPAVAVAYQRAGGFLPLRVEIDFERRCLARPDDCARWPLAIGDLDGDGAADFVFDDGVWVRTSSAGGFTPAFRQVLEPWAAAITVDLNDDGRTDVVASSATRPALQVLLNTQDGLFNVVSVDAGRNVTRLRAGDFDGDGVSDVALTQDVLPSGQTDISVIFGARDGPFSDPVLMGRFDPVIGVEPGRLPAPAALNPDAIDDLLVQVRTPSGPRVAMMTGTGQRRLHAPLALPGGRSTLGTLPSQATGADFDGDGDSDLVVVTYGGGLWLVPAEEERNAIDGAQEFGPANSCSSLSRQGFGCVSHVVARRADIGAFLYTVNRRTSCPIDQRASALEITRFEFVTPDELACEPLSVDPITAAGLDVVGGPRLADVNADGLPDLVVLLQDAAAGQVVVAIWRSAEGTPELVAAPPGFVAYDLAVINVDRDPNMEVAVLTSEGVHLLDEAIDGFAWSTQPALPLELAPDGASRRLEVADVNADGLDDLLIGTTERMSVYLGQQAWLGDERVAIPLTDNL